MALVDGTVSFETSHSYERMKDPQVLRGASARAARGRQGADGPGRAAQRRVEVTLRDGRTVSHFTRHAPGTKENPLDTAGVNAKARGLMAPVLGARRTAAVIERVKRSTTSRTFATWWRC